jgi:glutamine synthetase
MVDAIPAITTEKSVALFARFNVFSRAELESRAEVKYEAYSKAINIEARTMLHMAKRELIPAMIRYSGELAKTVAGVRECGFDAEVSEELLSDLLKLIKEAQGACTALERETDKCEAEPFGREQAVAFRDRVVPAMEALRSPVDRAEQIVDRSFWPIPTYSELLFEV